MGDRHAHARQARARSESRKHTQRHRISDRVADALATFGLTLDDAGVVTPPAVGDSVEKINALLRGHTTGSLVLLSGPSGTGKSTLLSRVAESVRERVIVNAQRLLSDTGRSRSARVVDLFAVPLHGPSGALRLLAAAGLADAHVLARRPHELSVGQQARLTLALAMDRAAAATSAGNRCLIIVDELGSGLDDAAAHSAAAGFGRWIRATSDQPRPRVSALCATTRDDLEPWLHPSSHIRVAAPDSIDISTGNTHVQYPSWSIGPGTLADYRPLSRFHYRAGDPATVRRVLVARERTGEVIGALLTSMPTLNASWRDLAWPGRYSTPDRTANAQRLNDELRCISRVIVDPRWRAGGVGVALIRAYLTDPETPATEALAAMGAACPMFSRAGMTEYTLAHTARDQRLLDALAHARIAPLDLVRTDAVAANVNAWLDREFRAWANGSRATRSQMSGDLRAIIGAAARTVLCRPRAYAHTRGC
jgi:ABC-type branched-subunit amino acid transport system ATPase component